MSDAPLLVLGASGLLGRTLLEASADAGRRAIGLSHADCDVTDTAAVERAIAHHRPSLVVNTAAFTNVDAAESDPAAATAVNAEGPAILAARTAAAGTPLVHVSTDYVFDGRSHVPYREDDPVRPLGHYGRSKAEGEARVRALQPRHVILRTAWLFGKGGGGFVRMAIAAALRRQPIRTVADQVSSPTAVGDLARAVLAVDRALGRGQQSFGTYHYAGREPASRLDMAETILAAAGWSDGTAGIARISSADFAAVRPVYSALDSSRFVATFGLPASDWRRALAALVAEEAAAMAREPAP